MLPPPVCPACEESRRSLRGPTVDLLLVDLRPVGAQGAQHQPRHDALPFVEVRKRAHEGDERVRARIEQVVVAEDAERGVLGAVGPEGHAPRLLILAQSQWIVLRRDLLDVGLRVAGCDLSAHHPVVHAARHEGHAVCIPGQLEGEWFGDGDGAEHVLDSQQRSVSGPGRRHRKQHGWPPVTSARQPRGRLQFHDFVPFGVVPVSISVRRPAANGDRVGSRCR